MLKVLCYCWALLFAMPVLSAEFETLGQSSSRYGYFEVVRMTRPIEEGDVSRLQKAVSTLPQGAFVQITLDSPGGEYDAALELARHIADKGFATHIDSKASCMSGYELAFMAGRVYFESSYAPRRDIAPGAVLGFHAPFVFDPTDDGIAPDIARALLPDAERAAALAAAEMVQLSLDDVMPVSLVRALLTYKAQSFLYIGTIDQIGRWDIGIANAEVMNAPDGKEPNVLRQATKRFCPSYVLWHADIPLEASDPTAETRSPGCTAELEVGRLATSRLSDLVRGARSIEFRRVACACRPGTESTRRCNFGRQCGSIIVDGTDVGQTLISENLAVPYKCGRTSCPPRPGNWCR